MAENQEYEAVLATEDDQNTVAIKGTGKGSEKEIASDRGPQEDIELKHVKAGEEERRDDSPEQMSLLRLVQFAEFNILRERLTAKALMDSGENPLLLAIKVIEALRERADGSLDNDPGHFIELANQVEEFTLRFLDPLQHEGTIRRAEFSSDPETDVILDTAIKLQQKKFFDHPIITDIINMRWYAFDTKFFRTSFVLITLLCLFDVVVFPLSFSFVFLVGLKNQYVPEIYRVLTSIPYFCFLRDTLSYVVLLGLHFVICLEPSQLPFSGLEWAILVFLFGRLLLEITQIARVASVEDKTIKKKVVENYLRDRWNLFDLIILFTYFCAILPLRIFTWASSETETANSALLAAGYLYGFNTMFLTFRTFGSILEIFEGVGTIQIALFHIIKDAGVVVLHFIVITLGFSSTVTKVLVVDNSVVAEDAVQYPICNKTGIRCWLEVTAQLGLSLLDLSDGLDFFKSADLVSQTLSQLLFTAYLIVTLILLMNMLIALLSNTYQRVQDNSRKEWAFQKAITVQTYRNFHRIPVPFNIISIPVMALPCFRRRKHILPDEPWRDSEDHGYLKRTTIFLQEKYSLKYGDSFPPTDPLGQILADTNDTVGIVNQVLYSIFTNQRGSDVALLPHGQQAWDTHENIAVEGFLLTCKFQPHFTGDSWEEKVRGARYRTPFSPRSPHFEILVLEAGYSKSLCVGVVFENHSTEVGPGFDETASVGFDTGVQRIYDAESAEGKKAKVPAVAPGFDETATVEFDARVQGISDAESAEGKKAKGPAVCRRGDKIRVTVMFGDEQERNGKLQVPVVFTVNGNRVVPEGNGAFIVYSPDKPLYPYIAFRTQNSVLAKMVMKDDWDHQELQMQEVKSELTKTKSELTEVKAELSEVKSKLVQVNESLEKKLDSVLAKLQ